MSRKERGMVRRRLLAPSVLVTATAVLFIIGGRVMKVPPMDDTYIHLVYGESLLSGEPMVYSGSRPSSGLTSPLWLVPSAISSLSGRSAGPLVLMGFSLSMAVVMLLLMGPLPAILLALAGPFLFHAASGMETSLSCLMVLAVWKWLEEGGKRLLRGGLILGASFLTRPELVLLLPAMIIGMDRRTPRRIALLAAPSGMAGLLWMVWNLHSTGLPLPSTFYAKQSVSWLTAAVTGLPGLASSLLITSPLLIFAAIASVTVLIRQRKMDSRSLAKGLVPVTLLTVTAVLQPNSYFQMRYWLPAITACILACSVWLRGLGRRRRLNTVILVLSLIPGLVVFSVRRVRASEDVGCIDVAPAVYLSHAGSSNETVAAADIGAVRWITGMDVIDLDGLVTPERLPGPERRGWDWIRHRADYLLAFPDQYSDIIEQGRGSIVFLKGFGSPSSVICGEDSVALWRIE